jgi:quinol monooxygenase YgiN
VSEKDNPAHIRIFEIYRGADAYKAHLESAHFKKYKATKEKEDGQVAQTTPN